MYIDVFRRNCHIFKLRCTNCFRVSLCFNIKLNLSHLLWNIISLKRDLFGFNSQTRHTLSNFPVYSRVMGVFISLISVVMLFFDSLIFFFLWTLLRNHEFSEFYLKNTRRAWLVREPRIGKIYFSFL